MGCPLYMYVSYLYIGRECSVPELRRLVEYIDFINCEVNGEGHGVILVGIEDGVAHLSDTLSRLNFWIIMRGVGIEMVVECSANVFEGVEGASVESLSDGIPDRSELCQEIMLVGFIFVFGISGSR